ncbi:hypothetical protein B0H16DRAFT_1346030 [Mycena metata]|uniref:Uncharacterized protein n=1 Tax=Mycena metata TaxID=1033252 RepID=A0AAD7GV34_9AGAR|nr:hypothetical protein B0H16DRAFT_1346030 [Mycena metata]
MIPDLEPPENPLPRGSKDVGNGFVFLTATDGASRGVDEFEARALKTYLAAAGQRMTENWIPSVVRWSRLRLPNGQVARSAWKESLKPINRLRCARNVKVRCANKMRFAEVHFYLIFKVGDVRKPLAVVSMYGEHHAELFQESSKTYVTMQHLGNSDVRVIDVDCIQSAVMLAPDQQYPKVHHDGSELNRWYLMEKPGLKLLERMEVAEVLVAEE